MNLKKLDLKNGEKFTGFKDSYDDILEYELPENYKHLYHIDRSDTFDFFSEKPICRVFATSAATVYLMEKGLFEKKYYKRMNMDGEFYPRTELVTTVEEVDKFLEKKYQKYIEETGLPDDYFHSYFALMRDNNLEYYVQLIGLLDGVVKSKKGPHLLDLAESEREKEKALKMNKRVPFDKYALTFLSKKAKCKNTKIRKMLNFTK